MRKLGVGVVELGKYWPGACSGGGKLEGDSDGIESTSNAGEAGSIPGSRRSPGEGNGYPLQFSLENSMDKGAWWAIVHGVTKSQTRLSD